MRTRKQITRGSTTALNAKPVDVSSLLPPSTGLYCVLCALTSDALANMKNDLRCPVPPFSLNPKKEVLLSLSMAFAEIYDYYNTSREGEGGRADGTRRRGTYKSERPKSVCAHLATPRSQMESLVKSGAASSIS